jgi:hypothetical protein
LSSDTRGFDLFASSVSTVSSLFQTAASSAELLSGGNEEVQKSIMKLMAIQNISNGIRQIANDLTTRGTAANKLYAFVEAQVAVATNATATATLRAAAAMKLLGIGLLIGALAWVADKMGLFGGATADTTTEIEKLNAALDIQNQLLERGITNGNRALEIRLARLKAAGATETRLNAERIIGLTKEKQLNEDSAKAAVKLISGNGGVAPIYGKYVKDRLTAQKVLDEAQKRGDKDIIAGMEKALSYFEKAEDAKTQIIILNQGNKEAALKKQDEAEKKASEEAKKRAQQERQAIMDLYRFRTETTIQGLEAIKNAEQVSVGTRANAAQGEYEMRRKLIIKQRDFELEDEDAVGTKRVVIRERAAAELKQLEVNLGVDLIRITKEYNDGILAEAEDFEKQFQQQQEESFRNQQEKNTGVFSRIVNRIHTQAANEQAALADKYKKGLKTTEEYNTELAAIEKNTQRKILEETITFYETQMKLLQTFGFDVTEMEKNIAEARAQIAGMDAADTTTKNTQQLELLDQLKAKYEELAGAIMQSFNDVVTGAFDRRKNQLQEQIDKVEELKESQIRQISESTDAEEKKAARIKIVEAKAAADRATLERQQRKLDHDKAVFEKAFKAMQVGISGFEAIGKIKLQASILAANPVTAPLAPLALAQIPISAAITAAQVVAILATPIPKYAKGTLSSGEETALVGEAGRELAVDRSGKLTMYNRATLANLKGGTTIFPNEVTERIMRAVDDERAGIVKGFAKATGTVSPDRQGEVIDQLKQLNKKDQKIIIHNEPGIETTSWWFKNMKY